MVVSKWNDPPFLIIETLNGTPIVLLSTYASISPSIISIVGAYVYPLPGFSTVIENSFPPLATTLNSASTPSPSAINTFGLT